MTFESASLALDEGLSIWNQTGTLDVVGIGIDLPNDLSLGGLARIRSAVQVYSFEPREFYADQLLRVGVTVEDLSWVFDRFPDREEALLDAVTRVVASAMATAGVVLLLGGHPTTAVLPMTYLPLVAEKAGLTLRIHPGVSSIDRMLADLAFDPTEVGLQIVRGSRAMGLASTMPVALLCPAYANTIHPSDRLVESGVLAGLLTEVYGITSEFFLYSRRSGIPAISRLTIDDIIFLGMRSHLGSLMIIGPTNFLPTHVLRRLSAFLSD